MKESGRFQKKIAEVKTVIAVITPWQYQEISVIQRLNCKKNMWTWLCYALELILIEENTTMTLLLSPNVILLLFATRVTLKWDGQQINLINNYNIIIIIIMSQHAISATKQCFCMIVYGQ